MMFLNPVLLLSWCLENSKTGGGGLGNRPQEELAAKQVGLPCPSNPRAIAAVGHSLTHMWLVGGSTSPTAYTHTHIA